MGVVPAQMRDRDFDAVLALDADLAGIRQSGDLLDRVRIHVGAIHHGRAGSIAQDADDAGLADPGLNLEAEGRQLPRDDSRGPALHESELRMLMDVLEDFGQSRGVRLDGRLGRLRKRLRFDGGRPGGRRSRRRDRLLRCRSQRRKDDYQSDAEAGRQGTGAMHAHANLQ